MDSRSLLLVSGGQGLVERIVVIIIFDRSLRGIFMNHILAVNVGGVSFGLFTVWTNFGKILSLSMGYGGKDFTMMSLLVV